MMLAAADLGIGTGHSSVGDQEAAREILGVPDDHDVAYMIGIGYPADRPLQARSSSRTASPSTRSSATATGSRKAISPPGYS